MTIPFILKKHKEEVQKTSDDIKILSDEQIKRVSGACGNPTVAYSVTKTSRGWDHQSDSGCDDVSTSIAISRF